MYNIKNERLKRLSISFYFFLSSFFCCSQKFFNSRFGFWEDEKKKREREREKDKKDRKTEDDSHPFIALHIASWAQKDSIINAALVVVTIMELLFSVQSLLR